jgi:hypothetical protein
MATKYGVNATYRENTAVPALEAQGESNSPIKVAFDSYSQTVALSQNDIVVLQELPPLARVLDAVFKIGTALDAAAGTVDIGWQASSLNGTTVDAADTDGFFDALDVTSAATFIMSDDKGTRPGLHKQFGNQKVQTILTATHSGGLDATAGAFSLAIYYSVS